MRKQPTGEPDAGDPHVRFGGEGASAPLPYRARGDRVITVEAGTELERLSAQAYRIHPGTVEHYRTALREVAGTTDPRQVHVRSTWSTSGRPERVATNPI